MSERPATVLDPVCGMTVNVQHAESAGLTTEYEGRSYAFCRVGCQNSFAEEPTVYSADSVARPTGTSATALPIIDDGMRRWYENCSCCLSDAYPEVKAALDAERAMNSAPAVEAGICEVAEAH